MVKILTLLIFFIAYAGIVIKREKALYFVYGAILLFLIIGSTGLSDIPRLLNYNVLGIFLGTSILSFLFAFSGIPAFMVAYVSEKRHPVWFVYLGICIITGIISMVVENIATIMIMAPVALELARRHRINPVPLITGMAISSNLQGCATMVGDSPSIILAMESGMNFNDFFFMSAAKFSLTAGRPGIFFFVQIGAVASFFVLYLFFRREKGIMEPLPEKKAIKSYIPLSLIIFMLVSLAISSFFGDGFRYFPAVICLFYAACGLVWFFIKEREEKFELKHIDWESFFLLVGIFILVGTLKNMGFIEDIAVFLQKTGGKNPFILYNIIIWGSVFVSSFVDNIPYTMAMISGVQILCQRLSLNPYVFLFGLLLGTCIGGNITPVGASCNVVGVGLLKKNGYKVSFKDFVKIGFPFTILAVLASTLSMWTIYSVK
ncbi:MAG TPA: SLC13 family permease [bacterium]|nr:SLC13 family permease [bacterium]HPP29649.1 SLC13 family permease [bacterium]